jgi:hypothetical protein
LRVFSTVTSSRSCRVFINVAHEGLTCQDTCPSNHLEGLFAITKNQHGLNWKRELDIPLSPPWLHPLLHPTLTASPFLLHRCRRRPMASSLNCMLHRTFILGGRLKSTTLHISSSRVALKIPSHNAISRLPAALASEDGVGKEAWGGQRLHIGRGYRHGSE